MSIFKEVLAVELLDLEFSQEALEADIKKIKRELKEEKNILIFRSRQLDIIKKKIILKQKQLEELN